jgi:hypothetical protein
MGFGQLSFLDLPALGLGGGTCFINRQDGIVNHRLRGLCRLTLLRHVQVVPGRWHGSLLPLYSLVLGLGMQLCVATLLIGLHIFSNRL